VIVAQCLSCEAAVQIKDHISINVSEKVSFTPLEVNESLDLKNSYLRSFKLYLALSINIVGLNVLKHCFVLGTGICHLDRGLLVLMGVLVS
jgi:hypothetical protein